MGIYSSNFGGFKFHGVINISIQYFTSSLFVKSLSFHTWVKFLTEFHRTDSRETTVVFRMVYRTCLQQNQKF